MQRGPKQQFPRAARINRDARGQLLQTRTRAAQAPQREKAQGVAMQLMAEEHAQQNREIREASRGVVTDAIQRV